MATDAAGRLASETPLREAGRSRPESEPAVETGRMETASVPQPVPSRPGSMPLPPDASESPLYAPPKSQLQKEIEDVLEEDLESIYWELSEPERLIFKHRGEEVASKIKLLLGEATVRVQEIFRLIIEWLKLLPGVNQFFVEKEAKIKTDKILRFR